MCYSFRESLLKGRRCESTDNVALMFVLDHKVYRECLVVRKTGAEDAPPDLMGTLNSTAPTSSTNRRTRMPKAETASCKRLVVQAQTMSTAPSTSFPEKLRPTVGAIAGRASSHPLAY